MGEKKVLLSVRDLHVKFQVRGRVLTAIRGASLDVYEDESLVIVGESGCGKSVLTKTFAGMLDNNGFVDQGDIVFNDEELTDISVTLTPFAKRAIERIEQKLNLYSKWELGSATYCKMVSLEKAYKARFILDAEEAARFEKEEKALISRRTEALNLRQTLNGKEQHNRRKALSREINGYTAKLKELNKRKARIIRICKEKAKQDTAYNRHYNATMSEWKEQYEKDCSGEIPAGIQRRNKNLAKEIYLSLSQYPVHKRIPLLKKVYASFRKAMELGLDLADEKQLNRVFEENILRVKYLSETQDKLYGQMILNLARFNCVSNWTAIRGTRIATIFQDPMTSLNPILTIGNQITSVIMKHQHVSELEARKRAIVLMKKVGIPNAENRFDDYPFQYSGGMRQRIVIAIALSCQPKILICDEPTTALDVTIQAQIIKLIKDLQKEFGYTIVFITHDLGIVANVADRVAVLYAGQIVELGKVEEIFYDPRHPYTWALLSSLPQLMERNMKLYSIAGTPPSLYNRIVGDAFAPRNPYCLKVDTLKEPPMFQVSDTHFAKTWLLDPRAPKVEKPEIIRDIHGTLMHVFNI